MTSAALPSRRVRLPGDGVTRAALAATLVTFGVLFAQPLANTVNAWWSDPEVGHGLLLAPLAFILAWRQGVRDDARANPALGIALLLLAVAIRYVAGLAADPFLSRSSMFLALAALVIHAWGWRQVMAWWLPSLLLALSVPLPEVVMGALALPLQLKASSLGAALLSTRGIPVHLDGNVIRLPGHDLFVTEACSGLRSLTALLAIGVLLERAPAAPPGDARGPGRAGAAGRGADQWRARLHHRLPRAVRGSVAGRRLHAHHRGVADVPRRVRHPGGRHARGRPG